VVELVSGSLDIAVDHHPQSHADYSVNLHGNTLAEPSRTDHRNADGISRSGS
jgi:hypothetical protein